MKVLVTGGAGYIGSITSNELLEAGHEVVVFDNLYQGHRGAVPKDAAFVAGDLRDAGAVARLFKCQTAFGEVFDAIADGLCYGFALLILTAYGWIPWPPVVLIVARTTSEFALKLPSFALMATGTAPLCQGVEST